MATRTVETYEDGALVETREVEVPVEQANADQTRQRAAGAIDGLRTLKNTSGTLTALQLSNAVRLLATGVLHLARLQLNRHEEAD